MSALHDGRGKQLRCGRPAGPALNTRVEPRADGSGGDFEDVRELVAGTRGRRVFEDGDTELGIWTAGIVQGLIRDIPTVAELVARMVSEAEDLIKSRLGRLVA